MSTWRRSPLLFSVFRYFVGIYRSSLDADCRLDVAVNQARIEVLGQLSSNLLPTSTSVPIRKTEVLFVVCMFGLSSSWYDLNDLGLEHYNAATALLPELQLQTSNVAPRTAQFFAEFLVYWWMMLSFAYNPGSHKIQNPPPICPREALELRIPHPLTGVSPESQLLLGMVGRLVLSQRRMALQQPATTAGLLPCTLSDDVRPRELESQLISLELPRPNMVLDPEDPHTSVHDLINIAQAYRLCGLLLLYHTYPNLLEVKMANHASHGMRTSFARNHKTNSEFLVSLAIHVLQVLEQNSKSSGTRTIEAILLLIISGELSQNMINPCGSESEIQCDICSQLPAITQCQKLSDSHHRLTVTEARSIVIARFERIQAILPFSTIRHMKSLVLETWRFMDQGLDVFWVDLLIKNNWQFVMI
ncbi:uncharacterized protein Z519_03589 [Cladophialophora bantiana CBS 173.52]|uniref:Transcription factor domain-containing protein n=1 Tax=Cladophialophora bantiana (strain ATCC 10958 / CBS 173.52 / CDC B-1940 / NIH 8579) TaxID=1442370 RepID=A0A0D2I056_CLAB1|nr:uncharacterized protein Z519_03589 [Cladophialophora bantiana CBS 173.52]KIW96520.1 hypothetical protein Z519_03589 [Cladophialophora bantiana CBS 173.52]